MLTKNQAREMQKFNFPVYSKNGDTYVKHITPSKCIVVKLDSINTQDYSPMFEEQAPTTTNHWDDVIGRAATIITKGQFDEYRKEIINQLINL